jgi:hypothetical protein
VEEKMNNSLDGPGSTAKFPTYLVSVEKQKFITTYGKVRLFPFIFAFLNILLCAYFDQYLQNDFDGYYLHLFFFIQTIFAVLFAVGFFKQSTEEMLSKTLIFPVSSWNRFKYIVISNLRQPLSLTWSLTTSLFFIVFYNQNRLTAATAIINFLLIILAVNSIVAFGNLLLKKSYRFVLTLSLIFSFLFFCALVSAVFFNFHEVLRGISVVSWATAGIIATQNKNLWAFCFSLTLPVCLIGSIIFIVKKFI